MTTNRSQHNWKKVKLGDIAKVISGYAFKSSEFSSEGIPVIKIKNVRVGRTDLSDADRVDPHFDSLDKRYHVTNGDVLISLTGSHLTQPNSVVGRVALHRGIRCLLNQRAGKIIVKNDLCETGFLFYALSTYESMRNIALMASGAASQANVSPTQVESVDLYIPGRHTQRKIASILFSYDELIENNIRRIAILEGIAQAVYREWFMEFRFPGHEKIKLVDSAIGKIPEGWKVLPMKDVSEVIDCLHTKKPSEDPCGNGVLLQLNNIGESGILDLANLYMISESDYRLWVSRMEASEGDCVVTNVGRVGAVAQIPRGFKAALGRNMTGVRPRREFMSATYLIQYLLSPYMKEETALKKDAGTIMDALNVKGIVRLSVPIATPDVMRQFDAVVSPMRRQTEVLVSTNRNLKNTRDLLLPKLISGQLDVEDLDIETGEAVTE